MGHLNRKTVRLEKKYQRRLIQGMLLAVSILAVCVVIIFYVQETSQASTASSNSIKSNTAALAHLKDQTLVAGTQMTTQVPDILPAGGVTLTNNRIVLRPLSQAQTHALAQTGSTYLTKEQAIAAARKYADAQPFKAKAQLVSMTALDSIPPQGYTGKAHSIKDKVVWLVTFTSDTPLPVGAGRKSQNPLMVTHYHVALDPATGSFVRGFFTD